MGGPHFPRVGRSYEVVATCEGFAGNQVLARLIPTGSYQGAVRAWHGSMAIDRYSGAGSCPRSDQSYYWREANQPLRVLQPDSAAQLDLNIEIRA